MYIIFYPVQFVDAQDSAVSERGTPTSDARRATEIAETVLGTTYVEESVFCDTVGEIRPDMITKYIEDQKLDNDSRSLLVKE